MKTNFRDLWGTFTVIGFFPVNHLVRQFENDHISNENISHKK